MNPLLGSESTSEAYLWSPCHLVFISSPHPPLPASKGALGGMCVCVCVLICLDVVVL